MEQIGFIGIGNMGFAMLKGAGKVFKNTELCFTDINLHRVKEVEKETNIRGAVNSTEIVRQCKYVVLAIKPQYYGAVLDEIKNEVSEKNIVISIAPGVTVARLKKALGEQIRIVRAMPNTPALVNEGMTGICYSADLFQEEEKATIERFFGSFGKYEVIDESLINAVVCASGSSPAYVYMFIEALADSAVKYGLPRDKAYIFAAQTVMGAAKMVLETGEHPGKLKDQVCSPGGTTIAGVSALEEYGFKGAVIKANDACFEKAESMKKE